MKKLFATSLIVAALAAPVALAGAPAATTPPPAPTYVEPTPAELEAALAAFRAILATSLKEVYKDQLDLTEEEGKKFWPIYEKYEVEFKKQNDALLALIKRYAVAYNAGPVDDATAKKLLQDVLAHEKDEMALRTSTVNKVMGVLPGAKAAMFAQIDNKVRVTIKYDIARQIPLID
jgi:Spy/CpxP family protein refolding chaperone